MELEITKSRIELEEANMTSKESIDLEKAFSTKQTVKKIKEADAFCYLKQYLVCM